MARTDGERTVLFGAGVFGFGLGALLDVLVFHLILQWHHLLSDFFTPSTLAGLRTNVYWDGLFSLAMVGVMAAGMGTVWRALNGTSESYSAVRAFGSLLVGAGLFNVFDGTVDHYVLGIHDAVHGTQAFNPHWVGASLLLLGTGILVVTR
ncbi:DUF2243 domain-containing protein [Halorussus gelatinilyticus]|uniref:DUF2243 domain-containing protein n=1 Tax=Halorussus gelatinilyticus TaxID=2937524 RepID=A0A8U0ILU7_9EURY|nr:DUF2243 domain-containing protein [Halorussus gelatinilyticus]UPW01581.1 DUF2243 domain-containing protein [Halorussus gelatinilyticus]